MKSDISDRKRLQRMLGITQPAITKLAETEGYMPRLKDGSIDIEGTVRGYIDRIRARRAQTADQNERLIKAKADLAELDYDRERGSLCDVRQVAACFSELHRACERAIAADKSGLLKAAINQALADWSEKAERIIHELEST